MASAAVVGGIILSLIEGMGIWMNNYFSMPPPGMEGMFICFVVCCVIWLLLVLSGVRVCNLMNTSYAQLSFISFLSITPLLVDPNMANATGPPVNDITAPPTTGGLGMIPTGLAQGVGRRVTQSTNNSTMMMGGENESSERFDDEYSSKTTFSSGGSSGSSVDGNSSGGGGWWPFGGSSS